MHSCRAGDRRGLLDPSALPALPVPSAPGLEQQSCPESFAKVLGMPAGACQEWDEEKPRVEADV